MIMCIKDAERDVLRRVVDGVGFGATWRFRGWDRSVAEVGLGRRWFVVGFDDLGVFVVRVSSGEAAHFWRRDGDTAEDRVARSEGGVFLVLS
ncbi:hypothetical protein E2542_SST28451 [Spatholobus suberectus]|nr:hypothetical protein E2542_SST28451 [Spatholobus suberectus]